ncbi:MAG: DUF5916 domain-containing protein [Gemmatimonadaceae bacterium]|nr:DUF5916 domain-containing protein [Gemmatimonadaceae bacterium]
MRTRLTLDGRLTEPEPWSGADSITQFTQRDPEEGKPGTERTVVRLLATPQGLAVGWWCYDRDPSRIVRSQLRRDASLQPDDYVSVAIDGLGDKRSAFYFRTNANGALWDGEHLTFESGNENWDGVWDARARLTAEGYVVEMLIPWATLRYRGGGDGRWGMNFRRFIRRKNEEQLWRSWRRSEGFRFLEREGSVAGFDSLPERARVEMRPYLLGEGRLPERILLTGGSDSTATAGERNGNVGLDIKIPVTRTLTGDITFNPDFAQAEVDRQIVNLTRFPLFFPEQRLFFTEGAGIFDFGRVQQTQMFYSRRIGLSPSGTPVPIPFGLRMQGRAGSNQVGFLASRTGGTTSVNDVVARVKHDVLGRGYVGAMATLSDRSEGPADVAGGVDFNLPYIVNGDQNLVVLGNAAWNRSRDGGPAGGHYRVIVDYPNDHADIVMRFDRVEAGYNPTLGFVQQRGIHRLGGSTSLTPRPRGGPIRRLEFDLLSYNVVWGLDWQLNNASFEVKPIGLQFQSGDQIELNLQRAFDAPNEPFEIFPGADVAAGTYWWNRVELNYSGSERRTARAAAAISTGSFYDGRSSEVSAGLRIRRSPHLLASLDLVHSQINLRDVSFSAQTVRLRADYALGPRLNTTLFAQWDNESNRAAVNARMRWTVVPGSDLYVVWNSNWSTEFPDRVRWTRPQGGGIVAKYVYFFRT